MATGQATGEGQGYRKILAWQRVHALALLVYEKTKQFPKAERYGLTQQLRRAALSVPANIVEGYARNSTQQYLYHLNVAYGSLAEVEYFLQFARDVGYLPVEAHEEIGKLHGEATFLLYRLVRAIERRVNRR